MKPNTTTWKNAFKDLKKLMKKYYSSEYVDAFTPLLEECLEYVFHIYLAHERKNNQTVFQHVVQSAKYLLKVHPDISTIQLCLLHEALMVAHVDTGEIKEKFGDEMLQLLEQFTKLSRVKLKTGSKEEIQNLREMALVLADDVRVIMVKLATRLHSLETVEALSKEGQQLVAKEALYVYAPLASRLGIYVLKTELEDAAYMVLQPEKYTRILTELEEEELQNKGIVDIGKEQIQKIMKKYGMHGEIHGRIKGIYSIAKKLKSKGKEHIGELYDIFALRVIVDTKEDCYRLFGYIHEAFPPIPQRIKDYIAVPKPNNYQSLHTTVTGIYPANEKHPVEIQIRTKKMDDVAEYGVASHSYYKEVGMSKKERKNAWKIKLAQINKELSSKGYISDTGFGSLEEMIGKVFVFTPKGEVRALTKGATPLDFAYLIHTEVGKHTVSARVNDKVVPLSYTLTTGDTVEVITRKDHKPTHTALLYAKTNNARKKIKYLLNSYDRDTYLRRGRQLLDNYLKILHKPELDSNLSLLDKYFDKSQPKVEEKQMLLVLLGNGNITLNQIIVKLFPELQKKEVKQKKKKKEKGIVRKDLHISHISGVKFSLAGCCNMDALYDNPNEYLAYVNLRNEIKIHSKTCSHIKEKDESRLMDVEVSEQT